MRFDDIQVGKYYYFRASSGQYCCEKCVVKSSTVVLFTTRYDYILSAAPHDVISEHVPPPKRGILGWLKYCMTGK